MATTINSPTRIHCLLLDLGRATDRAYGGAGFMLNGPSLRVHVNRAHQWALTSSVPLDERTYDDLKSIIRLSVETDSLFAATINIDSAPQQHIGLGTKTAILLATLTALAYERGQPLIKSAIQADSGRGGASGIGIHGFFNGGFIVDLGHPQSEVDILSPSSARHPVSPPKLAVQMQIPDHWRFHLLLPPGKNRSGSAEREFFSSNTPIPILEVFEAIAIAYHGIVAAVSDSDLQLLRQALLSSHRVGFKARELASQASSVQDIYYSLTSCIANPIGMSSMGPLIYVIADQNDQDVVPAIIRVAAKISASYLGSFSGNNTGYTLEQ